MALHLLTPAGVRWTARDDLPTTLSRRQLSQAGLLPSEGAAPNCNIAEDEDVLALESTTAGWQVVRNGSIPVLIRRSFGGRQLHLRLQGAVALLCHKDLISFGGGGQTGHLEVKLPAPVNSFGSDGSESDCCPGGEEQQEEEAFLPDFQRLSQDPAQSQRGDADGGGEGEEQHQCSAASSPAAVMDMPMDLVLDLAAADHEQTATAITSEWACTRCLCANASFLTECELCGNAAPAWTRPLMRSSLPVSVLGSPHRASLPDSLAVSPPSDSSQAACGGSSPAHHSDMAASPTIPDSDNDGGNDRGASRVWHSQGMSLSQSGQDARAKYLRDRQVAHARRQQSQAQEEQEQERVRRQGQERLEGAQREREAAMLAQEQVVMLQRGLAAEARRQAEQAEREAERDRQARQQADRKTFMDQMNGEQRRRQQQQQQQSQQQQQQQLLQQQFTVAPKAQEKKRRPSKRAKIEIGAADSAPVGVAAAGSGKRPAIPNRRQASSNFKLGLDPLPPVTVALDETVPNRALSVGALQVMWPAAIKPTRPQLLLMRHAAAALAAGRHALLESPTGTGKTLALLATVLATQWYRKQAAAALGHPYHQRMIYVSRTHAQLDQVTRELKRLPYRPIMTLLASRERFCLHADVSRADDKAAACADATHIGQGCCTHLDKAEGIGYPQRQAYRKDFESGGGMAVYDIEEIVKDNTLRHVCPFHATRDLMTGEGTETEGWAAGLILITYQQLINVCVREASGTERVDEAHNLDSDCRDTASLELCPAALAAHLDKLAEFKHALELGVKERGSNPETQRWLPGGGGRGNGATMDLTECVKAADKLIEFFERVQRWFTGWSAGRPPSDRKELSGRAIAGGIEEAVAKPSEVTSMRERLRKMRQGLVELGVESEAVKSTAINESDNQLMRFDFLLRDHGAHYTAFYCHPASNTGTAGDKGKGKVGGKDKGGGKGKGGKDRGKNGNGKGGGRGCFHCGATDHMAKECPAKAKQPAAPARLHLLCWSASVGFEPVAKRASSILLTSGTLQPMSLLQSEFFSETPPPSPMRPPPAVSSPQPGKRPAKEKAPKEKKPWAAPDRSAEQLTARREFLQFSAPHFESVSGNLLNLFVSAAPTAAGAAVQMVGDYKSRSSPPYLMAVGNTVLGVARQVPHGLLVYFASTNALHSAVENWTATGLMAALGAVKEIFVEPTRATADEFDRVLADYKAAAASGRGAALFAVLRGRASEGLNFSHDHARGVVMVSIAYPPIYDIKVQAKLNRPRGRDWYTGQAFKAANQAIGRLIRNTEDYGVLVLLDRRYAGKSLRLMLPSWVRRAHRQWHVREAGELAPGLEQIGEFFRQKAVERDAAIELLD